MLLVEPDIVIREPAVPAEVAQWMDHLGWGPHHQMWHYSRLWDKHEYAKKWVSENGSTRAPVQEGAPGNGLDFLGMHRAMVRMVRETFPQHAALWTGWKEVPTDPINPPDPTDAVPTKPGKKKFDRHMLGGLARMTTNLASFTDDDDFGLFMQTKLRPLPGEPLRECPDPQSGLHNYLHSRFAIFRYGPVHPDHPISMSNFTGNIRNQRFWRLHGWIDNLWTEFRTLKNLSDKDPAYLESIDSSHMSGHRDHA